jgi:hypothetical protein
MANAIKRYSLTPQEAAEKALIADQLRTNPRGPWVNGKKTVLPVTKSEPPRDSKKR